MLHYFLRADKRRNGCSMTAQAGSEGRVPGTRTRKAQGACPARDPKTLKIGS